VLKDGMTDSRNLCLLDDIADGDAVAARVETDAGGFELIVLRAGNDVYAYHNECPHAGRRLDFAPGRFLVRDGRVICAAHGATFAVATGACVGGPCRNGLVGLPVVVVDGAVRLA
jgi:nitrite reductase/ring-hydroxylating ferredoxin subunit